MVFDSVSPRILSISRRTDIPAFHSEWLLRRLEAGFAEVPLPYGNEFRTVFFGQAVAAVLWSKNPLPLLDCLDRLNALLPPWYLQYTLNDYPGLEPELPPLENRLDTFRRLADRLGMGRVVWRFDPVVAAEGSGTEPLMDRIARIGERLAGYTDTLTFSFLRTSDYKKVRENLDRHRVPVRDFTEEERCAVAAGLARLASGWGMRTVSCCMPDDFIEYGIEASRCIDDRRFLRLFPNDEGLREYLRQSAGRLLPETEDEAYDRLRDRHQRARCGCIRAVDIGTYNSCPHGCLYCYANRRPDGGWIIPGG